MKIFLLIVVLLHQEGLIRAFSRSDGSSFSHKSYNPNGIFGGQCPDPLCDCFLDERGRMEIACVNGQMTDIPMGRMNPSTEVIRIVGPEDRPNYLTIGRLFRQFKRLEELHIVGSNIPNIGENSFWGVQSLRVLNLSRNNISQIMDANFKGLVNVENMSLSDNAIESLVSASFQHLSQLKLLDISKNRVTKLVERLFYNLHMLEVLDLSQNRILELNPDVFRDIWRLKDLRCRMCALKTINPLLYELLPGLQVLDLGQNEFKYLNKEEFSRLPRLHTLYLDGNQISAIVDHAFHSVQLRRLTLGSNRIVRIARFAFSNSSIESLDLSNNKYETLDKLSFGEMSFRGSHLRELDLSSNPKLKMSSMSVILGENPQLLWLSIAQNELEEIPLHLFELQGNLRHLNLSGNRLSELYVHQLSHLVNLQVLDLSGNRMKRLDGDILLHIDRVATFQEIRLEDNPWHCDLCNIVPLLRWVQRTHFFKDGCAFAASGPACLRCTAPRSLQGRSLLSLDEKSLDWCSSEAEPILSGVDDPRLGLFLGCALIVIILISAAICVILRGRFHAAHYYTHEGDRPEIATPPAPPPQDTSLFPETNGMTLNSTNGTNGRCEDMTMSHQQNPNSDKNNGFDNIIFHNHPQGNGGAHDRPSWHSSSTPSCDYNREKMIATIEEMTYETQLAYPELAPISLQPPVPTLLRHHPQQYTAHSSSSSARSTPIYCCPGHHQHNNNHSGGGGNGGGTPPWNNNNSSNQSFRRF